MSGMTVLMVKHAELSLGIIYSMYFFQFKLQFVSQGICLLLLPQLIYCQNLYLNYNVAYVGDMRNAYKILVRNLKG
jgi:hypothetical protein